MKIEEKAEIILDAMDRNGIQIDWNMGKFYISAIVAGLKELEQEERNDEW